MDVCTRLENSFTTTYRYSLQFLNFFHKSTTNVWTHAEIYLKISLFAGKRCAGVCLCPYGLISPSIFLKLLSLSTYLQKTIFMIRLIFFRRFTNLWLKFFKKISFSLTFVNFFFIFFIFSQDLSKLFLDIIDFFLKFDLF